MKNKKSYSKYDYYLMLLDEFKDQFTIVLILNLLVYIVYNQFNIFYSEVYLFSSFKDFFNQLSYQFSLTEFFTILGYIYLFTGFVHFGVYKKNIKWLFLINALLLLIFSTYVWLIPTFDSIITIIKKGNIFFITSISTQIVSYIIVVNEFLQLFKKVRKQPEINHS